MSFRQRRLFLVARWLFPLACLPSEKGETEGETDADARRRVERIAMEAVRMAENRLGHTTFDVSAENAVGTSHRFPRPRMVKLPQVRHIEVKGRAKGAIHHHDHAQRNPLWIEPGGQIHSGRLSWSMAISMKVRSMFAIHSSRSRIGASASQNWSLDQLLAVAGKRMKPTIEFVNLVGNGFDFLKKSMQEFDKEPKFSVIHFYSALELFLKARFPLREHWTLFSRGQTKGTWRATFTRSTWTRQKNGSGTSFRMD